jgi:hypothetical protein
LKFDVYLVFGVCLPGKIWQASASPGKKRIFFDRSRTSRQNTSQRSPGANPATAVKRSQA